MSVNLDQLIEFYKDQNFQTQILEQKNKIEQMLKNFLINLENSDRIIHGFSKRISSRIKSADSLREKIKRKGYIDKWGLTSETQKDEFQIQVAEHLPDLIGLRINCYFSEEEEKIFDELIAFLSNESRIILEKNSNQKMKNGEKIYKISGKHIELQNKFSFEIQVKSYLLDVWGEVEHKLIYKKEKYDSRIYLKEQLIREMYSVLGGVDRQLGSIFKDKITIPEVKKEMFYLYSNESINDSENLLGEHYNNFFKIISLLENYKELLNKYLSEKILDENCCVEKHCIQEEEVKDFDIYNSAIDQYKLSMVFQIASVLYEFKNKEDFLNCLVTALQKRTVIGDEDDEEDDEDKFQNILTGLECLLTNEARVDLAKSGKEEEDAK